MIAFAVIPMLGGSAPSWLTVACALPLLMVIAPQAMRRHRRIVAAAVLASVLAVGLAAADDDFILVKPKQCETASIWDADYWIYGCITWDLP